MATYEIVIRVPSENKGTSAIAPTAGNNAPETEKALGNENTTLKDVAKTIAGFYASTSLVRSAVHAGVGLMSVKTGNSIQQQRVEAVMGLVETGITTAIAFAINPVAGALSLASTGISLFSEARKNEAAIYRQSLSAYQVRERAGGAFNRSREMGEF